MQRVGIIGLGLLGGAFARRFIEQGFAVSGYDTDPDKQAALTQYGGQACENVDELFANCPVVLLSLPNSTIAAHVVSTHALDHCDGQVIVDTTTGDPAEMLAIDKQLALRGLGYVEATVAGSSAQAERGEAVIFVGGDHKTVQTVQPMLEAMSSKRFHLGPVGAASRFKLVHNLILGLNRAVLAEGLAFAESQGFGLEQTLEVLKETPAFSGVMLTKGRKMVERDYSLQARLSQHLKDVRLILQESERTGVRTPLSEVHRELLETAEKLGFGANDNSAVIEAYRGQQ